MEAREDRARLVDMLGSLEDREVVVILNRFFHERTLKETAKLIGKSKERVRQIQIHSMYRLRHDFADELKELTCLR